MLKIKMEKYKNINSIMLRSHVFYKALFYNNEVYVSIQLKVNTSVSMLANIST